MLRGKRILLIISGGIAAYKSLELIRALRAAGAETRCVLTAGGRQFVTPLSVAALSGEKVYEDLFSLTDEAEMGHIELSRSADLIVVAPASADLLAKMAHGIADDLASTLLLATDTDVLAAPAMNVRMWTHAATRMNVEMLAARSLRFVGPDVGEMACGETGPGRMAEPDAIVDAIARYFGEDAPLAGRRALVTSGPTVEPIDPVRFIANRSSGRQGHAIAAACAGLGAEVTLVSGPTRLPDPEGVRVIHIETAREMLAACREALPVDVAICAAAVSDWRVAEPRGAKIKKRAAAKSTPPRLDLVENPDILADLAAPGTRRPALVVGFAAETEDVVAQATAKRARKGCDWILANDVSPGTGTFGGARNTVHLISAEGAEPWPEMSKDEVARRLASRIAAFLDAHAPTKAPVKATT